MRSRQSGRVFFEEAAEHPIGKRLRTTLKPIMSCYGGQSVAFLGKVLLGTDVVSSIDLLLNYLVKQLQEIKLPVPQLFHLRLIEHLQLAQRVMGKDPSSVKKTLQCCSHCLADCRLAPE